MDSKIDNRVFFFKQGTWQLDKLLSDLMNHHHQQFINNVKRTCLQYETVENKIIKS